jgi:hypothetical protein
MIATGAIAAISALALGPVDLRGGDVVTAPIEEISIVGVRVGGEEPRTIAWDAVRLVTGERAAAAAEFAAIAEQAWRARLRLARGDHALAAPIFEKLWLTYREVSGPTALMVAEGTLACRLATGRAADAIEPWLHAVALREAGIVIAGDPPLAPVLDAETMLVPALAPVWLDARDAKRAGEAASFGRTGLAGDLAAGYIAAARRQAGDPGAAEAPSREHPGAALVRLIAEAVAPDAARREAARFAIAARLDADAGSWREAWLRAALGRSYLLEADARARTVGVFHLMHLPARFAWSHPRLATMALALAARELAAQGDAAGAAAVRAELERLAPGAREIVWLDAQATDPVQPDAVPGVDPTDDEGAAPREEGP